MFISNNKLLMSNIMYGVMTPFFCWFIDAEVSCQLSINNKYERYDQIDR